MPRLLPKYTRPYVISASRPFLFLLGLLRLSSAFFSARFLGLLRRARLADGAVGNELDDLLADNLLLADLVGGQILLYHLQHPCRTARRPSSSRPRSPRRWPRCSPALMIASMARSMRHLTAARAPCASALQHASSVHLADLQVLLEGDTLGLRAAASGLSTIFSHCSVDHRARGCRPRCRRRPSASGLSSKARWAAFSRSCGDLLLDVLLQLRPGCRTRRRPWQTRRRWRARSLALTSLTFTWKTTALPASSAGVVLGEGDVDVLLLTGLHADDLILKAGDKAAGAQLQVEVLTLAALEGNAVVEALKVDDRRCRPSWRRDPRSRDGCCGRPSPSGGRSHPRPMTLTSALGASRPLYWPSFTSG